MTIAATIKMLMADQEVTDDKHQGRRRKKITCPSTINSNLQAMLWDLPHSSADKHIPGKLSLCIVHWSACYDKM
jgi:hypothetical protein